MTAAEKWEFISEEDYLATEEASPVKREFWDGVIYAMAGGRILHHRIAGNAFAFWHGKLRGKPCQPYNSDTKIRILLHSGARFYYPDASVVCQSNPGNEVYQDAPVVILEVMSRATRRIDLGEKKDAYLTIPSLAVYLLAEQAEPRVIAYRRGSGSEFGREIFTGLDATIPLPEIGLSLPLAELYEGVDFAPEPEAEEG